MIITANGIKTRAAEPRVNYNLASSQVINYKITQ